VSHPPTVRRPRRRAALLVALASGVLLAAGGVALGQAAHAALVDVPVTGTPGRLVLSSDPYPAQFLDLEPGQPGYWEVEARLEDASRATLQLELRKSGALVAHPRGLIMTVDACTEPWTDVATAPGCAPGAQRITVATPADDDTSTSPMFDLAPLQADAPEYLLVTLAVEDSAAASADRSLMGLTGDMAVGLTATAIDDVPGVPPSGGGATGGGLAATGFDGSGLFAVAAIAAGLLGLGVALRLNRKGIVR
jgi:hypothetical protein